LVASETGMGKSVSRGENPAIRWKSTRW
jgi:hypothetical protein